MNITEEEIEDFVLSLINNVYNVYSCKCPLCDLEFKYHRGIIEDTITTHINKNHTILTDNFNRISISKLELDIIPDKYNDIKELSHRNLYTLFLSLIQRKRYTNSKEEETVFDRCITYVKGC